MYKAIPASKYIREFLTKDEIKNKEQKIESANKNVARIN